MELRNPVLLPDGRIDCEINHPTYGWIPFTADMNDIHDHSKEIYQAALAMNPVEYVEPPAFDENTESVEPDQPVLVDGEWRMTWKKVPLSQERQLEIIKEKADEIRLLRNQLLDETDYIVTMCVELGLDMPSSWKNYRQALRNIPEQPGFPLEVIWPIKPNT